LCPFHEITGFTLTLLEKVPRTQNSEKKFQESRLFPRANLILRPVSRIFGDRSELREAAFSNYQIVQKKKVKERKKEKFMGPDVIGALAV